MLYLSNFQLLVQSLVSPPFYKSWVYYNISVLFHLNVYTTITMCILRSLCVYFNMFKYTEMSMCILSTLCVFFHLHLHTSISIFILQSLCVYFDTFLYTSITMCILQSLCACWDLYDSDMVCSDWNVCVFRMHFEPKCRLLCFALIVFDVVSVTRLGEILPLWPNLNILWKVFDHFKYLAKS